MTNYTKYRFLDHTGDAAVEVFGTTLEELFENSAEAFTSLLTDLSKVKNKTTKNITVEGNDNDQLLLNLLSELIFHYDVNRFLCFKANITNITSNKLTATLEGEILDESKHEIYTEIKAVTYHELNIHKEGKMYKTKIVFDL
ncbi:MAG: archease [Spirochaetota bacterium]|nr:archease [Spirochaetota bacterium]